MRRSVWLQLLYGWLPVGALFAVLILSAHPGSGPHAAVGVAIRMMIAGALLGFPVHRLTKRLRWPQHLSVGFVLAHAAAASLYAVAFVLFNSIIESLIRRQAVISIGGAGLGAFLILGVWLYVMIAGVTYANEATIRAARAEALAVSAQLAALRSQLNPHFLFNALHTVVHLIPRDPARAATAAEEVAGLLRTTLEEDRDVVTVAEELDFVRRYLAVERLRFADRLTVVEDVAPSALDASLPVFALQTLVENAIRHGASANVDPTSVAIRASVDGGRLAIVVSDTGPGASLGAVEQSAGTGLRRLRERLEALYGNRAALTTAPVAPHGFTASLSIPYATVGSDE